MKTRYRCPFIGFENFNKDSFAIILCCLFRSQYFDVAVFDTFVTSQYECDPVLKKYF